MNEELQKAISELINKSISGIDAATSFIGAEIPDVIHQLLMYKMIHSAVETVFLIASLVGFCMFWRFYAKTECGFWKDHGDPSFTRRQNVASGKTTATHRYLPLCLVLSVASSQLYL